MTLPPSRPGNFRGLLQIAGTVLAVVAIAFVLRQLYIVKDQLRGIFTAPSMLLAIPALSVSYAVALAAPAAAWAVLLVGRRAMSDARGFLHLYAVSNLGKYLPGNVLHFGMRQVYARKMSVPQGQAAMATLSEQLLQIPVVGLIAGLLGMLTDAPVFPRARLLLVGVLMLGAASALLVMPSLMRFLSRRFAVAQHMNAPGTARLLAAAILQAGFFFAVCVIVAFAYHALSPASSNGRMMAVAGIYLWCWLVGFVTPGVPGGLGVREALIVVTLGPSIGNDVAVSLGLVTRLITILGDCVFAMIGAGYLRLATR